MSDSIVIGVIADSHDHLPAIKKAVSCFNENHVDIVIHAGDIVSPFTACEFKRLQSPFIGVFGNNDGDRVHLETFFTDIGKLHSDPYIGCFEGYSIAVTHIPIIARSLAMTNDIVIYGHTHEREITYEPALIINPGECCGYLTGHHTVALLYPQDMQAEIITL